ncbi:MAG: undecaprenyl-diphosphatase UppP [Candidatus Liptonbacteria bacterium]
MTIIQSIILGLVEGITEFLPISSTAHLLLVSQVMYITETDFVKSFTIIIQLGAILAVAVLYFKKLLTDWGTAKRIAAAFMPTAIIGFILYKFIKGFLFVHPSVSIITLIVFGVALILFERLHIDRGIITDARQMSYKQAALLGLAQAVAVIPGVSRSGATIVAGMLMGMSRVAIVEFSFLLAVPTMIAASGYDLLESHAAFSSADIYLLAIGFVTAFIAAILAVKFFLNFISRHSFEAFGWYRIAVAVLAAWFLLR